MSFDPITGEYGPPFSEFVRRRWPELGGLYGGIAVVGVVIGFFALPNGVLVSVVVGLAILLCFLVHFSHREERQNLRYENAEDYRLAQAIGRSMRDLLKDLPKTDGSLRAAKVFSRLSIGEVTRFFDQQTVGSINGWIQHALRTWGTTRSSGQEGPSALFGAELRSQYSTGYSSGGVVGTSMVNLTLKAVTRTDLFTDGFVAVLELRDENGAFDTLRVVAPAEAACKAFLQAACDAIGRTFGEDSHRHNQLREDGARLAGVLHTDVSYVSDRLSAALRLPTEERPPVTAVGSEITPHAILVGAMSFEDPPENWYQLFPLALLATIPEAAASTR